MQQDCSTFQKACVKGLFLRYYGRKKTVSGQFSVEMVSIGGSAPNPLIKSENATCSKNKKIYFINLLPFPSTKELLAW